MRFNSLAKRAATVVAAVVVSTVVYAVPSSATMEKDAIETVATILESQPELQANSNERPKVEVRGAEVSVVTEVDSGVDIVLTRVTRSKTSTVETEGGDVAVGDTVVETSEDGVRIVEVIDGPDVAHRFVYKAKIDGERAQFFIQSDGSVIVGVGEPDNFEPFAGIEAPWAFDADADKVRVRFKTNANNNRLIMVVRPDATATYPIIADPSLKSHWWGKTLKLNKSETDSLVQGLTNGQAVWALSAAVCGGAGGKTGALCATVIGIVAASAFAFKTAINNCRNSKGVDLHRSFAGNIWCSGY